MCFNADQTMQMEGGVARVRAQTPCSPLAVKVRKGAINPITSVPF